VLKFTARRTRRMAFLPVPPPNERCSCVRVEVARD
jgi:hypothetical protein